MPYDPRTGQVMPYSTSYSSMGMEESQFGNIVGSMPGLTASIMLGQRRGANTIMKGGFLDREAKLSRLNPITRDGRQAFRFKHADALRRFVGDELTGIDAGGRFRRGSYAGPMGLRAQKAARMQARMLPEGALGPPNIDPRGKIRGSNSRYNRIMTALHRRNWSSSKS